MLPLLHILPQSPLTHSRTALSSRADPYPGRFSAVGGHLFVPDVLGKRLFQTKMYDQIGKNNLTDIFRQILIHGIVSEQLPQHGIFWHFRQKNLFQAYAGKKFRHSPCKQIRKAAVSISAKLRHQCMIKRECMFYLFFYAKQPRLIRFPYVSSEKDCQVCL